MIQLTPANRKKVEAAQERRKNEIAEMQRRRWAKKEKAAAKPNGKHNGQSSPRNGADINGTDGRVEREELSAASSAIDATLQRAAAKAGTDLAGFARLPKSEQNAFLAEAKGAAIAEGDNAGVRNIPLHLIDPSPFNRKHFDPEREKQLIESIRQYGVQQNGTARPSPVKPGRFELVAGERRWNGSKAAGKKTMPLKISPMTDEEAIEMQAVENLHREDLNPLDEAVKYQQLIECYGKRGIMATAAVKMVHEKVKVSEATIYERMRLLKLPDEAKEAVLTGRLPSSHAALIAKLEKDRDAQREVTARILKPKSHEMADGEDDPVTPTTVMSFREAKFLVERKEDEIEERTKFNKLRDEFLGKGYAVLSETENKKLFPQPYSSDVSRCGYVQADYTCAQDRQCRNWKETLGKFAPNPVLAHKPDGRAVVLYVAAEAKAALKKKGIKAPGSGRNSPNVEDQKRNEAHKVREHVFAEMLKRIGAAAGKADPVVIWRFILSRADAYAGMSGSEYVAKNRGISFDEKDDPVGAIQKHYAGGNGRDLREVIVELLVCGLAPGKWQSGWDEDLTACCNAFGISLPKWDVQTSGKESAK